MPEQGVVEAGLRNLGRPERRVRAVPVALEREVTLLGPVEQGEVNPAPVGAESVEEAGRVGRSAVRGAPEGDPVSEFDGRELPLVEDVNVGCPRHLPVEARRAQPVMVARSNEHSQRRKLGERRTEEFRRVRSEHVLLVEVAAAAQRVHAEVCGQVANPGERLAQRLPA